MKLKEKLSKSGATPTGFIVAGLFCVLGLAIIVGLVIEVASKL